MVTMFADVQDQLRRTEMIFNVLLLDFIQGTQSLKKPMFPVMSAG